MFFKCLYTAFRLHLRFKDKGSIAFHYNSPRPLTVSFSPNSIANEGQDPIAKDVACEATVEREPSDKIREMYNRLARNEMPEGSTITDALVLFKHADRKGNMEPGFVPPLEVMPESLRSFQRQVTSELRDFTARTVELVRWRLARPQDHHPFSQRLDDQYSFDGDSWHRLPTDVHSSIEQLDFEDVTDEMVKELEVRVEDGQREPIAHVLFREAWASRHSNLKSSLLIGIAAAEVGFKQYASRLAPDAQWLIENLPSPPLERMLRDYFPILAVKSGIPGIEIPKATLETLKKGIQIRNSIAHKDAALRYETLEGILIAVRDLLWILDYCAGHDWARDRISDSVRGSIRTMT